jgi:hypothetical protein
VTHLEPGIGQGETSCDPPGARDWARGEEEAGEAPDGVREGGKIYLTHTGLDEEHHVTHLEPGIGRGGEEEAGEAPDRVREGGAPSEVGQRHQHPLSQHSLLVLQTNFKWT